MNSGFLAPRWPDDLCDATAVRALAKRYWDVIKPAENSAESVLEAEFPAARARGVLDKDLFVKAAGWKSPRPRKWHLANLDRDVREQTALAFRVASVTDAIRALEALKGVAVRTASALLHWMRPEAFPILDVYVLRAMGWSPPSQFTTQLYETFAPLVLAQARSLDVGLRVFDRAAWTWAKLRRPTRRRRLKARPVGPRIAAAAEPQATVGADDLTASPGMLRCRITNVASHPERARLGDRLELCIDKRHSGHFPVHGGKVELLVRGHRWRCTVGHTPRVGHIYFHSSVDDQEREEKITAVLRRAGFDVGDRPWLRMTGRHSFVLQHSQDATE